MNHCFTREIYFGALDVGKERGEGSYCFSCGCVEEHRASKRTVILGMGGSCDESGVNSKKNNSGMPPCVTTLGLDVFEQTRIFY